MSLYFAEYIFQVHVNFAVKDISGFMNRYSVCMWGIDFKFPCNMCTVKALLFCFFRGTHTATFKKSENPCLKTDYFAVNH